MILAGGLTSHQVASFFFFACVCVCVHVISFWLNFYKIMWNPHTILFWGNFNTSMNIRVFQWIDWCADCRPKNDFFDEWHEGEFFSFITITRKCFCIIFQAKSIKPFAEGLITVHDTMTFSSFSIHGYK